MNTLTVHVANISCAHCVHTIQTELGKLPGVSTVRAEAQTRLVNIGFEAPATRPAIEALLAEINYPVDPPAA